MKKTIISNYFIISSILLLSSLNIKADTDWGALFEGIVKEAVSHKIDEKARIRRMRIVEQTSESLIIDVVYNKLYKFNGVEMEAHVLRGGSELNGFDSTVADIESKSHTVRLTLTWADAKDGSPAQSDQIKIVLSREGVNVKSKSFDLAKKWMTLADAEQAAEEAKVAKRDTPDDSDTTWDSTTTGEEDSQDTASVEPLEADVTPSVVTPSVVKPSVLIKPFPAVKKLPLKLYWNSARTDNFSTATVEGERSAKSAGYRFVRIQGEIFERKISPDMVPLKTYWHPVRKDNLLTASSRNEKSAISSGYKLVRTEGFLYNKRKSYTIPLRLFYNPKRQDYFSATSSTGVTAAKKAGYRYMGIEGYVIGQVQKTSYRYTAKTKTPIKKIGQIKAGNITWNCINKTTCTTIGPWPMPGIGACSTLSKAVGAKISEYGHPGKKLTNVQLNQCNKGTTYLHEAVTKVKSKKTGRIKVGGLLWNCRAKGCSTRVSFPISSVRTCALLVKEIGQVTFYGHQKHKLTPAQLAQCNRGPLYRYTARTIAPVKLKGLVNAKGIKWRCAKTTCFTTGTWSRPSVAACANLSKLVGPIAYYGHPRGGLSNVQVKQCNALALKPINQPVLKINPKLKINP